MPYDYFDHEADIGVVGIGSSLEEAFQEAAKAMFNVMFEIKNVSVEKEIEVECEASNIEELLVEWLNRLLTESTINEMVFSDFEVKIDGTKLKGISKGENIDHKKHKTKIEVKAATYSQLKIKKEADKIIAQCVVDV